MSSSIMTASRRGSRRVRLRTAFDFAANPVPLGVPTIAMAQLNDRRDLPVFRLRTGTCTSRSLSPAAPATTPAPVPADAGQENRTPATTPKPVQPNAKQDTLPQVSIRPPRTRPRPVEARPAAPKVVPRARKVTSEPPKSTPSRTGVSGPPATVSAQPGQPPGSPRRSLPLRAQARLRLLPLERLPKSPVAWASSPAKYLHRSTSSTSR